jgi:hypothetical protein
MSRDVNEQATLTGRGWPQSQPANSPWLILLATTHRPPRHDAFRGVIYAAILPVTRIAPRLAALR